MATKGKEILGDVLEKEAYDARGRQINIFRLLSWDSAALLHMVTYRLLIFAALITAFLYFISITYSAYQMDFRIMLLVVWILFIPQLFAVAKGLVAMATEGLVFGSLNKSYLNSLDVDYRKYVPLRIFPYATTVIWVLGLFAMAFLWFK